VIANFEIIMCHHRPAAEPPATTRRDPALRASDDERESTVSQLREHGVAGRLDVEELEQRVAGAYAARTHGELDALFGDLGGAPVARRPAAARPSHGHRWGGFVQVSVLLVAIWAVSGAGYFWPAWVMVWWAFALVLKSGPGFLRLR
jgi:hypothetical protein